VYLTKDGVIGRRACGQLKIWVLRFRLMVKRGPHGQPQASDIGRASKFPVIGS
jgi:hypothetical protein